ncbi:MAG: hypothetical protein C4290_03265 [Chloroflexota bacterium]
MTGKRHPPARAGTPHTFLTRAERRILAHLRLRGGGCYLDVGCGTGADAIALAARLSPGGLVLGLDVNGAAFADARRGAASRLAVFLLGDAQRLPFREATFDGVRAKRVLHHVHNPAWAVAEMARVTRPGGRVVAIEPDWGTAAVSGARPHTHDPGSLVRYPPARLDGPYPARPVPGRGPHRYPSGDAHRAYHHARGGAGRLMGVAGAARGRTGRTGRRGRSPRGGTLDGRD